MKTRHLNALGCSKGRPKRVVYCNSGLSQEARKVQIHNETLHLKEQDTKQQIKPKVSRRREIINIRAEITDIEMTTTTKQYNISTKLRAGSLKELTKLVNH